MRTSQGSIQPAQLHRLARTLEIIVSLVILIFHVPNNKRADLRLCCSHATKISFFRDDGTKYWRTSNFLVFCRYLFPLGSNRWRLGGRLLWWHLIHLLAIPQSVLQDLSRKNTTEFYLIRAHTHIQRVSVNTEYFLSCRCYMQQIKLHNFIMDLLCWWKVDSLFHLSLRCFKDIKMCHIFSAQCTC